MAPQRPKGNFEAVSELLGPLLQQLGLHHGLREYQAVEAWPTVVGQNISKNARATAIRNGLLYVDVSSSVWMQELSLLRGQIAEQLNEHLGGPIVQKIILSMQRDEPHGSSDRKLSNGARA